VTERPSAAAPGVALALALATAVAVSAGATGAARVAPVGLFLLLGPGLALVGPARLNDRFAELLLAVAASLVLDLLVAEALVLAGRWSADAALGVLLAVAVLAAGVQLATRFKAGPPASLQPPRRAG
jgi:hypothetical protein